MVKLCLSHTSALDYWRHYRPRICEEGAALLGHHALDKKSSYPERNLRDVPPSDLLNFNLKEDAKALRHLGFTHEPISLLVAHEQRRCKVPGAILHSINSALPNKSILEISHALSVASPELCFVQLATMLDIEDLALLGCELCGFYSAKHNPENKLVFRPPLTSKARLMAFATKASTLRGSVNARKAIPLIADDFASPKEAATYALLCFPQRLGGYGLPSPTANKAIKLSPITRRSFNSSFYIGDLVWPKQKILVEYDGIDGHTGQDRIAHDARRRDALTAEGYSVFVITKQQLYNVSEFYGIASAAAKLLGIQLRCRAKDFDQKNERLRKKVLQLT